MQGNICGKEGTSSFAYEAPEASKAPILHDLVRYPCGAPLNP
jgi:hypothetical protein